MAVATAGMAGCELWTMQVTDLQSYMKILQWYNLLRWAVTIALVGFIHFTSTREGDGWNGQLSDSGLQVCWGIGFFLRMFTTRRLKAFLAFAF
jgi:hypothetical protein